MSKIMKDSTSFSINDLFFLYMYHKSHIPQTSGFIKSFKYMLVYEFKHLKHALATQAPCSQSMSESESRSGSSKNYFYLSKYGSLLSLLP